MTRQPGSLGPLSASLSGAQREFVVELRRVYCRSGMSLKQLETVTHFSDSNWSRYLSGRMPVPLAALQGLARLVQLTRSEWRTLLGLHDAMLADQVRDAPAAGSVPKPSGELVVPRELPPAPAHFTGRADVLDWLDGRLPAFQDDGRGGAQIIAITGTAGVGKTALAVHWAHRVGGSFDGGQLYVDLRGSTPNSQPTHPATVLVRFLHSLGMPPEDVPLDEGELEVNYRSCIARRRMLVVLDNAGSASQVRPLLPGYADCLVLVTSRLALTGLAASHGVQAWKLGLLAPDEAVELLGRLVSGSRVHDERAAVGELSRRCAYLPLALRIVGAKLQTEPHRRIGDVVDQLACDDPLGVLEVGDEPELAVRTAFDASYTALDAAERRAFRLLGAVPGRDISTDAAAVLFETDVAGAASLLDRLARAHLIDEHAPGRFQFHDLLRAYAQQRSDTTDEPDVLAASRERLIHHYLDRADEAGRHLLASAVRLPNRPEPSVAPAPFADSTAALSWLQSEHANLVAAATYCSTDGPLPLAWHLADALRSYFFVCSHPTDWVHVGNVGLAAAERADDRYGVAAMHLYLGQAHWQFGAYDVAAKHLNEAISSAHAARWLEGEASGNGILGTVYEKLGRLTDALRHHRRALALDRRHGNVSRQAVRFNNLGNVYDLKGRPRMAARYCLRALEINRAHGNDLYAADNLNNLGMAYHHLGRLDEAAECLGQAIELYGRLGVLDTEATVYHTLAEIERDRGNIDVALAYAQLALTNANKNRAPSSEAEALSALGSIHHHKGDPRTARDFFQRAIRLARDIRYPYREAEALTGLAQLHADSGLCVAARRYAEQALAVARRNEHRMLEAFAQTVLAVAVHQAGRRAAALDLARDALVMHRSTGNRLGITAARSFVRQLERDVPRSPPHAGFCATVADSVSDP